MSLLKLSHRVSIKLYVFFLSVIVWLLCFGVVSAEQITSFVSDITINADSSVLITETIAYDFGTSSKHGFLRDVYETHPQSASTWYKDRYIDYELRSVTRDSQPEPYTLQRFDGLSVKIGDPGKTITGKHTYVISYLARGILAEYPEGVELYWNVTGDEWKVPIDSVAVIVRVDDTVQLLSNFACYAGYRGSNTSCADKKTNGNVTYFSHDNLSLGQQLTVAQRLSEVNVEPYERFNATMLLVFGFGLVFVIFLTLLYRWRFKYRTSRPVIAQYEPYADFKPMFTGVLFDNRLDVRDITAGIIYLAQQGFISIRQITEKAFFLYETNDYEIELLKPQTELKKKYQRNLVSLLFHPTWSIADSIQTFLTGRISQFSIDSVTKVRLSELKRNHVAGRKNYVTIQKLRKSFENKLVQQGFFEENLNKGLILIPIVLTFVGPPVLSIFSQVPDELIAVVFSSLMICIVLFALFATERRTTKGYEALWHLEGFKQFLSVTEKERYKFHNAPEKNPQQFMEYLPYAIAFGVEKEWAEVFKGIQIEPPSWYAGDVATFNATSFTNDIGSFAKSFTATSGTSGTSGGSGGGGSAGGGGGGGGGGSW